MLLASYTSLDADHIFATTKLVKDALEESLSMRMIEKIIYDRRTLTQEVLVSRVNFTKFYEYAINSSMDSNIILECYNIILATLTHDIIFI